MRERGRARVVRAEAFSPARVRLARGAERPRVGGEVRVVEARGGEVLDVLPERAPGVVGEVRGVHRVRDVGVVDRGDAEDARGAEDALERDAGHAGAAEHLQQAHRRRVVGSADDEARAVGRPGSRRSRGAGRAARRATNRRTARARATLEPATSGAASARRRRRGAHVVWTRPRRFRHLLLRRIKLTCAAASGSSRPRDRPPRTLRNARDAGWRRAPPRPRVVPDGVATPSRHRASPRRRRAIDAASGRARGRRALGIFVPGPARADDDASPSRPPPNPVAAPPRASRAPRASPRARSEPPRTTSPWEYLESDADAFDRLLRALDEDDAANVLVADADRGVVAAALTTRDGVDDYEFFFTNDGGKTVLFRAQSRVARASPPGCFVPGCIGPAVRRRADALRERLGWLALETDEEKQWVPLLLH